MQNLVLRHRQTVVEPHHRADRGCRQTGSAQRDHRSDLRDREMSPHCNLLALNGSSRFTLGPPVTATENPRANTADSQTAIACLASNSEGRVISKWKSASTVTFEGFEEGVAER
jgi:hypothetical protein